MIEATAADSALVSSVVAMIRVADVMNSAKFYRNLGFEIENAEPRDCPPFHWAWLYQPKAPNWKTGANLMLVSGAVPGTAESKSEDSPFLSLCARPEVAARGPAGQGLQRE